MSRSAMGARDRAVPALALLLAFALSGCVGTKHDGPAAISEGAGKPGGGAPGGGAPGDDASVAGPGADGDALSGLPGDSMRVADGDEDPLATGPGAGAEPQSRATRDDGSARDAGSQNRLRRLRPGRLSRASGNLSTKPAAVYRALK